MVSSYRVCAQCGEYRQVAHRRGIHPVVCFNCADRRHPRGVCLPCLQDDVPVEQHHVGGRAHHPATVARCLNCHAELSTYQRRWHRWLAEADQQGWELRANLIVLGVQNTFLAGWRQLMLREANPWCRLLGAFLLIVELDQAFDCQEVRHAPNSPN